MLFVVGTPGAKKRGKCKNVDMLKNKRADRMIQQSEHRLSLFP